RRSRRDFPCLLFACGRKVQLRADASANASHLTAPVARSAWRMRFGLSGGSSGSLAADLFPLSTTDPSHATVRARRGPRPEGSPNCRRLPAELTLPGVEC